MLKTATLFSLCDFRPCQSLPISSSAQLVLHTSIAFPLLSVSSINYSGNQLLITCS